MRRLGILGALVVGGAALGLAFLWVVPNRGVVQPIDFDHSLHAGRLTIDCLFCHRTARQGAAAGIPSLEQCMFCHRVVGQGNPEVEKLRAAESGGQPVDWRRVHRLPDTVHFTHDAHQAAGFACSTCHGEVAAMARVRQVRDLQMGDCLGCHRREGAPTDCNTCHY